LKTEPKERQKSYLQRLAADEVGPSADFAWDTFLAGELLAHAAGEKLGGLEDELAYE
jgi:hypothetical protein